MLSCHACHAHFCMNLPGMMSENMQQGSRAQLDSINNETASPAVGHGHQRSLAAAASSGNTLGSHPPIQGAAQKQ